MSTVAPGWHKDPADPQTQRYWDGEGWVGEAIPADATPPPHPPADDVVLVSLSPAGVTNVAETGGIVVATPGGATAPGGSTTPGGATAPGVSPSIPGQNPPMTPAGAHPLPAPWTAPHPYPTAPVKVVVRPHGMALAGVGSRFVARLVDVLAVFGLCAIANSWFAYQWWQAFEPFLRDFTASQANGTAAPAPPVQITTLTLMMCVVAMAVWFAYEVPGSANTGQTLGKRLLGIKIVKLEADERLGFSRAFRRWGRMGLPVLFWPFWGIGFALQFIDCLFGAIDRPLHQALHDKSAGTVVVNARKPAQPELSPVAGSEGGGHAGPR